MTTIKECMSKNPEYISAETSLCDAAAIMADNNIGFLPVATGDRLVGMVTDRDIVIRGIAGRHDPQLMMVRDVMSPNTYYCFEDQDVGEVCQNMADLQVRRMPVMDRNKQMVGIISFGDLSKAADEQTVGACECKITEDRHGRKAA